MRPPTAHTGLPAEALRRRSPNAVAVFAAHAQASDWLMPKLRPLELSDTALEPRRAHGQRRRGASAQRWRGAHSVAAAAALGRFCSELTLRSETNCPHQVDLWEMEQAVMNSARISE